MKTMMAVLLVLGVASSALAVDKSDLDLRLRTLTGKLDSMQRDAEKRIPAENLRKAQGIILLDRTKAGFIFAYQGGSGVAMVRDPKSGKWGPAAFLSANEASLGLQVGGQQSFVVILLMNTNATRLITDSKFDFGGEASGTAGEKAGGVSGTLNEEKSVLMYDDRSGLYGGAAIKGGALSPDNDANHIYYEKAVTIHEILFEHKVKPTEASTALAEKLNTYSKADSSKR
jgi:lipid-binding SYLF domain-containing protein